MDLEALLPVISKSYLQNVDLFLLQLPRFVLNLGLLGVDPHHPLLHL